jgi:hypothetical protein
MNDITIPKHLLLNWLYSTDRSVSINKLSTWLENNTNGQCKLVRKVKTCSDIKHMDNSIPRAKAS